MFFTLLSVSCLRSVCSSGGLFVLAWQAVETQSEHLVGLLLFKAWTQQSSYTDLCLFVRIQAAPAQQTCFMWSAESPGSISASVAVAACQETNERREIEQDSERRGERDSHPPTHPSVCLTAQWITGLNIGSYYYRKAIFRCTSAQKQGKRIIV